MHTLEYTRFPTRQGCLRKWNKNSQKCSEYYFIREIFRGPMVLGYSMLSFLKEKDETFFHFQIWIKHHTLQYEIYPPKQPPRWYNKEVWGH